MLSAEARPLGLHTDWLRSARLLPRQQMMATAPSQAAGSDDGFNTSPTAVMQASNAGPLARAASRTSATGSYCRCLSSSSTKVPR